MVTPAVRASTTKRARPQEVYDKMTTVRNVSSNAPAQLQAAIAATIAATQQGVGQSNKLREDFIAKDKADLARTRSLRKR